MTPFALRQDNIVPDPQKPYRPPFWDSKQWGAPYGDFDRKPPRQIIDNRPSQPDAFLLPAHDNYLRQRPVSAPRARPGVSAAAARVRQPGSTAQQPPPSPGAQRPGRPARAASAGRQRPAPMGAQLQAVARAAEARGHEPSLHPYCTPALSPCGPAAVRDWPSQPVLSLHRDLWLPQLRRDNSVSGLCEAWWLCQVPQMVPYKDQQPIGDRLQAPPHPTTLYGAGPRSIFARCLEAPYGGCCTTVAAAMMPISACWDRMLPSLQLLLVLWNRQWP